MKADAGLLREALPLMEDVQRPEGRIPRMPTERLRREVRAVFDQRQRPQGRLRELLKELEGLVGGGRAAALLQALEGAVLGGLSAEAEPGVLAEERGMAFIAGSAPVRRAASRPRSPERPPEEAERRRREREIAWRLRSMEMRLGEAVDRLGSVSEEARVMLAKIHEERME